MRDVVVFGGDVEVSAENKRLAAGRRHEQLHFVVPAASAVEAAFSTTVRHINTEELRRYMRREH